MKPAFKGWSRGRDIETPCESLLTRSPSQLPKPARKAGFSTFESGCGRETDCLLEGDGFELPVPRELGLRRGRRLALYLGSLTLRRRGPDWNATKRRRDSERRASTAAERGIEKTDELRRLKNAIAVGTPITGRPPHRTVRAAFLHTAPTSDV